MALVNCAECKREVSSEAAACPACGHPVAKTQPAAAEAPAKKSNGQGCFIAILIGLAALITLMAVGGKGKGDAPTKGDPLMACIMAGDFVKERLKAPSTADFGRCSSDKIAQIDSVIYMVSNYVDSENSFGAKIRTNFVCTVQYTGNNNWRLITVDGL